MPTIPDPATVAQRMQRNHRLWRWLVNEVAQDFTIDQLERAFASLNDVDDHDQLVLYLAVADAAKELGLTPRSITRRRSKAVQHLAALIRRPDNFHGLSWGLRRVFRRANVLEVRKLTEEESQTILGVGPWSRYRTRVFNHWLKDKNHRTTLRDLVHPEALRYNGIRERLHKG